MATAASNIRRALAPNCSSYDSRPSAGKPAIKRPGLGLQTAIDRAGAFGTKEEIFGSLEQRAEIADRSRRSVPRRSFPRRLPGGVWRCGRGAEKRRRGLLVVAGRGPDRGQDLRLPGIRMSRRLLKPWPVASDPIGRQSKPGRRARPEREPISTIAPSCRSTFAARDGPSNTGQAVRNASQWPTAQLGGGVRAGHYLLA